MTGAYGSGGYRQGTLRLVCRKCNEAARAPHVSRAAHRCIRCRASDRKPHACLGCGAIGVRSGRRCDSCSFEHRFYMTIVTGRYEAQAEVSRAKAVGALRAPRGLACTDCGGSAVEYEHRDYNRPLDVQPICRGCNLRRKRAIPRAWSEIDALRTMVGRASRSKAYREGSGLWQQMFRRVPARLHGDLTALIAEHFAQAA